MGIYLAVIDQGLYSVSRVRSIFTQQNLLLVISVGTSSQLESVAATQTTSTTRAIRQVSDQTEVN